jgi:hypothetical protein
LLKLAGKAISDVEISCLESGVHCSILQHRTTKYDSDEYKTISPDAIIQYKTLVTRGTEETSFSDVQQQVAQNCTPCCNGFGAGATQVQYYDRVPQILGAGVGTSTQIRPN